MGGGRGRGRGGGGYSVPLVKCIDMGGSKVY